MGSGRPPASAYRLRGAQAGARVDGLGVRLPIAARVPPAPTPCGTRAGPLTFLPRGPGRRREQCGIPGRQGTNSRSCSDKGAFEEDKKAVYHNHTFKGIAESPYCLSSNEHVLGFSSPFPR